MALTARVAGDQGIGMGAYSPDSRRRVAQACDRGTPVAQAADTFAVHRSTVHRWLKRRRDTGSIAAQDQHAGRPAKLGESQRRRPAQLLGRRCDATLARLREQLGLDVSLATVHRALQRIKWTLKKKEPVRRGAEPTRREGPPASVAPAVPMSIGIDRPTVPGLTR